MPGPLDLHLGERLPYGVSSARRDGQLCESLHILLSATLLLCVFCASCGAVGSGSPPPAPPPVTVTVMPNSAQPFPGVNVQFHALVENASSPAVNWQVNQVPGGDLTVGTISPTGFYAAPNSVPNPATVTVTAVLQKDPTKSGSASVTIQSLSAIQGLSLSPALSSVTITQTLELQVVTPGVTANDVSWAVDGISNGGMAVGIISATGIYSPPSAAGPHLITATLNANPGAIGSATVEVTDFPGTLTWRNDNSRSGVNSKELVLSPGPGPGTVNSSTFGKLFSCPIDGYAYAQPLYVPNLIIGARPHNVVFVATEKDYVFAFDADDNSCQLLWKQTNLIPAGEQVIEVPSLQIPNTQIGPFLGITGTPVIDGSSPVPCLYVVAATLDPPPPNSPLNTPPSYLHRLYALNLATGTIIQASPSFGFTNSQFQSAIELQRSALLLDNGSVYVAFGSNGTPSEYHGWLFGNDASSLQPKGLFNVTPLGQFGGIWQSGGGPSADSNHNLFVATGNGPPNQAVSYSDSFLRLGTNGGLSVADYFTPCDQGLDWGVSPNAVLQSMSSAPVLMPDSAGSLSQPHLLIGGSKNGSLYVVDRDSMGGIDGTCRTDSFPRIQIVSVSGGAIFSTPLFWNGNVYVAPGNGNLMAFPMSAGVLASSPAVVNLNEKLGPQGATPVISWNEASNLTSTAILWLIDTSGAQTWPTASGPAILRAYDPNNLSNEIYSSPTDPSSPNTAGPAVKFTVPTVANGKVYVGTQSELDVYGLLP
jgi:hypothetical protein